MFEARIHARQGDGAQALEELAALISTSGNSPSALQKAYGFQSQLFEQEGELQKALASSRLAEEALNRVSAAGAKFKLQLARGRFEAARLKSELQTSARGEVIQRQRSVVLGSLAALSLVMLLVVVLQFRRHRRLQAEVETKFRLEALGRLTGGVAHDFNNLLSVIHQSIDLLRLEDLSSAGREILDEASTATQTGSGLIRQLLDFSRGRTATLETVSLDRFLEERTDLLRRTAGDAVRVSVECEPGLQTLAVADQLTAVLINLVANARDAIENAGTVSISAVAAPRSRSVILTVGDTGHGIARHNQARVFEPFFTTKDVGVATGLGLSIVFGLVRGWGGEIDLSSEVGSGTVVRLRLRSA
ncbi:MAG: ATP-binding protein [Myxococcota bacterium]